MGSPLSNSRRILETEYTPLNITYQGPSLLIINSSDPYLLQLAKEALNSINFKEDGISEEDYKRIRNMTLGVLGKESDFGSSKRFLLRSTMPGLWQGLADGKMYFDRFKLNISNSEYTLALSNAFKGLTTFGTRILESKAGRDTNEISWLKANTRLASKGIGSQKNMLFWNIEGTDPNTAYLEFLLNNKQNLSIYPSLLQKILNDKGIDWKNRKNDPKAAALTTFYALLEYYKKHPNEDDYTIVLRAYKGRDNDEVRLKYDTYKEHAVSNKDLDYSLLDLLYGHVSNLYSKFGPKDNSNFEIKGLVDFISWLSGGDSKNKSINERHAELHPTHKTDINMSDNKGRGKWKASSPVGPAVIGDSIYNQCAAYANDLLRKKGYNVSGDAWTRATYSLYNGFDHVNMPVTLNRDSIKHGWWTAADDLKEHYNLDNLDKNESYDVNLYYSDSPKWDTAFKTNTNNRFATHTGNLIYKDGKWVVEHEMGKKRYEDDAKSILGSDHNVGITGIFKVPKKK